MISDVLFEGVEEIDRYLSDSAFAKHYSGQLRERIARLRDDMNALREELDRPPSRIRADDDDVV